MFFEEDGGAGGGLVVIDSGRGVAIDTEFVDDAHYDDNDDDGS